ncbi:hypothetical protein D3C85_1892200 [compost metagenome]
MFSASFEFEVVGAANEVDANTNVNNPMVKIAFFMIFGFYIVVIFYVFNSVCVGILL